MNTEFLLTSLVVIATPGTGVVLTLAAGLSSGPRAAAATALGCTLGIVPHMAAALTGLAALLHASALAFDVLKYAGVIYLLYVAWASLQADGPLAIGPQAAARTHAQWIGHALWANVLNPKLSIFLPRLFAAVRRHYVEPTGRRDDPAIARVHGADIRSVCALRRLCRADARPGVATPRRAGLAAAQFRGRVRAAGRATGLDATMTQTPSTSAVHLPRLWRPSWTGT